MGIRIGDGARDALFVRQQNTPQTNKEADRAQTQTHDQLQREQVRDSQSRQRVTRLAQDQRRVDRGPDFSNNDNENAPPDRTGFGQGSVSVPGSAVKTLRSGLDAGKNLVPTLEEAQTERRNREALQKNALQKAQNTKQVQQPNLGASAFAARANAGASAQAFVNGLSATAENTATRLRGEEPEKATPAATVTIGSQSFQLDRNAAEGTILNVRV